LVVDFSICRWIEGMHNIDLIGLFGPQTSPNPIDLSISPNPACHPVALFEQGTSISW
jgi:hypothetical protein